MDINTAGLLRDFVKIDKEAERKELVAHQVRSEYPINIFSIADDPEQKRLDSLVQSYSALHLINEADDSGSSAAALSPAR